MSYTVPKSEMDFWGAEYVNPKGQITHDMILQRIKNHVKFNALQTDGLKFQTDESLQRVLKTSDQVVNYSDILPLLGL
jgi:hypothetical protein